MIGGIDGERRADVLDDRQFGNNAVDMPHRCAAGQGAAHAARCAERSAARRCRSTLTSVDAARGGTARAALPAVADKTFLITIGDRTVGGLISRDQMVGPWQVPVADVARHAQRFLRLHR